MADPIIYDYDFAVTEKGAALMARQQLSMHTEPLLNVEVTRAVAAEGSVSDPAELPYLEDVLDPAAEMQIGPATLVDKKVLRVRLRLTNEKLENTVLIRQVGIYAMDPDEGEILYQVIQYRLPQPLSSIQANRGALYCFEETINLSFANAEATTLPQVPGWFLTEEDMETHNTDPDAHPLLNPNTCIATVYHGLGVIPLGGLYEGINAYGAGGYGDIEYGGSELEGIPLKLMPTSRNTVKVFAPERYSGFSVVMPLTSHTFALSRQGESEKNLTLVLR